MFHHIFPVLIFSSSNSGKVAIQLLNSWAQCPRMEKHGYTPKLLVDGLEHVLFSHILGISSSQLTNSIIFQDGYCTSNQLLSMVNIHLDPPGNSKMFSSSRGEIHSGLEFWPPTRPGVGEHQRFNGKVTEMGCQCGGQKSDGIMKY